MEVFTKSMKNNFMKMRKEKIMNKQEDILLSLYDEPFINQRILSEIT